MVEKSFKNCQTITMNQYVYDVRIECLFSEIEV